MSNPLLDVAAACAWEGDNPAGGARTGIVGVERFDACKLAECRQSERKQS